MYHRRVTGPIDTIEITTPTDGSMAAVVRAVVMSAGVSAALTVDRVEDVALAANEAFRSVAAGVGPEGSIVCRFQPGAGSIEVSVEPADDVHLDGPIQVDRLGDMILSGVTDAYESTPGPGISFTLANKT